MSPSRVHSQPSPKSAHDPWTTHVHPHGALQTRLPFGMQATSPRPVGCAGLAFRKPIQPTLTAHASRTWTGLVKMNEISHFLHRREAQEKEEPGEEQDYGEAHAFGGGLVGGLAFGSSWCAGRRLWPQVRSGPWRLRGRPGRPTRLARRVR